MCVFYFGVLSFILVDFVFFVSILLCIFFNDIVAEFSAQGEKCWLDISIIPTGDKKGVRCRFVRCLIAYIYSLFCMKYKQLTILSYVCTVPSVFVYVNDL